MAAAIPRATRKRCRISSSSRKPMVRMASAARTGQTRRSHHGDAGDAQTVIFDCVVDKNENCLPMIPSGKAHNEMILPGHDAELETRSMLPARCWCNHMNAPAAPLSPYSSAIGKPNIEVHTLSVLVDNEPGVLAASSGFFPDEAIILRASRLPVEWRMRNIFPASPSSPRARPRQSSRSAISWSGSCPSTRSPI